jgi:hypothetical protein
MASVPFEIMKFVNPSGFYTAGNRLLKDLRSVRDLVRRLRGELATLPALLANASESEIDELIDPMLRMERQMQGLRAQAKDAIALVERSAKGKSETRKALLRRISIASDQMYLKFLKFMRDARWEVMALCAEREPSGTEPEISSAEDLRNLFEDLQTVDAP